MTLTWGPWSGRDFLLDRMTLRDLLGAFFTHYSIQVYLALFVLAIGGAALTAGSWSGPVLAGLVTVALYPLVEYVAHRFILHSQLLYRSKATAKVWKRIHFDHHQNPHDLGVLFGALYTTLPTIVLITFPLGWAIAGLPGLFAAFAGGLGMFTIYEFCHCVQHLPFTPQNRWLRAIKKRHLAHHFHNEHGNFGITSQVVDRAFGTFYDQARQMPRSATAFNLGYTADERARYPWVGELSLSEEEYAKRRTRRAA